MDAKKTPPKPELLRDWLTRLFDEARDYAAVLVDTHGRIAAWSGGARNIFGYEADEVIGLPVDTIFSAEDREARAPAYELATAQVAGRAYDDRWHVRKDGSRFWATGATVALRDEAGTLLGFGKVMRDRTDMRMEVETLKNRLQAEVQARERRDVFLATLAHELRNPLAPLSNAVQLIRLTAGNADLQYPLQVIERQIQFVRRMVDDMMDLTRMTTGKLKLQTKRVVLQDVASEALASVAPAARSRNQQLEGLLPEPPAEIDVDPDRLQQILVNLLANAIKYTPEGGRIWLRAGVEAGHALLRIEDTGIGISPELQPKLFDLFTQGDSGTGGRASGLGIGLALVKELVALHNGTVTVRSEGPGKGSEFTVRLPLREPGQQGPATAS